MRSLRQLAPVVALAVSLALPGGAVAVHDDVLQLDGDTVTGTVDDWNAVYLKAQGLPSTSTAKQVVFLPDVLSPDPTFFAAGNQDRHPVSGPGGLQCSKSPPTPPQTNLLHAYAAVYTDGAGDLRVYFGANRANPTGGAGGTKNMGFWFFQDVVSCQGVDGPAVPFTGSKTHGDILVIADYASGGDVPTGFKIYMWKDPDGIPENGDECLGDGTADCTSAHAGEAHPLVTGGDCTVNPHLDPRFCGTVNSPANQPPAGEIDAAWLADIGANQFWELGFNLSQIGAISNRCYRTAMAESRSSVELETASLRDFVLGYISTCAEVTIRKETVGGNGTAFHFSVPAGLDPALGFDLGGGDAKTYVPVAAGTYTIAETVPAGWQLTDIQCTTGGGAVAVRDVPGASVQITLDVGATVDCTFTNTLANPTEPDLTLAKTDSPDPVVAGGMLTYTLTVENLTGIAAADVEVVDTLPAGTAFVSCTPPGGAPCDHAGGVVTADLGTVPGNASRTITIVVTAPSLASGRCPGILSNTAVVNASNESNTSNNAAAAETACVAPAASLTVDKVTVPAGDPQAFDFEIRTGGGTVIWDFPLADADPPFVDADLPAGTYRVAEVGVPAGWVTAATCAGGGAFGAGAPYTPGTAFALAAGEAVSCTFTNLRLRPDPNAAFCGKTAVQSLLNGSRFPNNQGLDHVVRVDLGESIQTALDAVNDENGDGYVLIGVVANGTGAHGGHTAQHFAIDRVFPMPLGLIGCSVTVHDDALANGLPTARITAGAGPSIFVMDVHAADSESTGWLVDGDQRELRNVNASGNQTGLRLTGSANVVTGGFVEDNAGAGIEVTGSGNKLDSVRVHANGGPGIAVSGPANLVYKAAVGDKGKGNGSDGIRVSSTGNVVRESTAYANGGHGVAATGAGHQLLKNIAGDLQKGNGGDGINASGTGLLLQDNRVRANRGDGVDLAGGTPAAPNRVRGNLSNTATSNSGSENAGAEYRLRDRILNAGGGNKADNVLVPKTTTPKKCAGFPATNATVTFASAFTCE